MIQRIQTCEQCGASRQLSDGRNPESPEIGGWRTLNNGSLEATFCAACVKQLVVAAKQNHEERSK